MKYSQQEAEVVVATFQEYIETPLDIKDYYYKWPFHYFEITPIELCGKLTHWIRFKDELVEDCLQDCPMRDIDELIKACFISNAD